MAQSAQSLFSERYENIVLASSASKSTTSSIVTFTPDSDAFYYHHNAFYYKDRAKLHFNVTNEFLSHVVLIRGLIEFTRSKELKFTFTPDRRGIEIDLEVGQFDELTKLFRRVYSELKKEIRFRVALKRAIEVDREYQRERADIYLAVG